MVVKGKGKFEKTRHDKSRMSCIYLIINLSYNKQSRKNTFARSQKMYVNDHL